MDNQATTPFGYVQEQHFSMFGDIGLMLDETDTKKILTTSPLKNWRRPPGHPHTSWIKTTQQDGTTNS